MIVKVLKSLSLNFIQILDQQKFNAIKNKKKKQKTKNKKQKKKTKNGQFKQLDLTDA